MGAFLMTLVVAEQAYYYYKDQETRASFQSALDLLQEDADNYSQKHHLEDQPSPKDAAKLPTLLSCQVMDTHQSLDGTLMLKNVKVGDVVQVVTAEIGPGQNYHLCRLGSSSNPRSVGWYPTSFLKQLEY